MRNLLAAALAALLFTAAAAAQDLADAELQPQVENGITFVSGGIGASEQAAIGAMSAEYSLQLVFSAPGGAYLSAVDVALLDGDGKSLLETATRGPMFLAKLPPGRYQWRAGASGYTTVERAVEVPADGSQVKVEVRLQPDGA